MSCRDVSVSVGGTGGREGGSLEFYVRSGEVGLRTSPGAGIGAFGDGELLGRVFKSFFGGVGWEAGVVVGSAEVAGGLDRVQSVARVLGGEHVEAGAGRVVDGQVFGTGGGVGACRVVGGVYDAGLRTVGFGGQVETKESVEGCGSGAVSGGNEVEGVVDGVGGCGGDTPVIVPDVGVATVPEWRRGSGVSGKTLRNRQWRQERKERKHRRQAEGKDVRLFGVPRELSESWVARRNAENELAAEKARKDLEYQRKRDVEAEVRKSRARILKATEQDKVAVEKAFSTLKTTGNVPGYCETVFTKEPSLTEGETISPDSSISQAEIRAMHKELLDKDKKIRDLERKLELEKFDGMKDGAFSLVDGSLRQSVKDELSKRCGKNETWEYHDDDAYGDLPAATAFIRKGFVIDYEAEGYY